MTAPRPNEITAVLSDLAAGDTRARQRLFEMIYDEMHRMAKGAMRRERVDHTLQATALVNEAYVRLFGTTPTKWDDRGHFFGAAAEVMRRVLIDHAREKVAEKRGGLARKLPLDAHLDVASVHEDHEEVLAIDEALSRLEATDQRKAEIVKLRFFGGLSIEEIAAVLEISEITVKRDWRYARAWLNRWSSGEPGPDT